MTFIDHKQVIAGQEIDHRPGMGAGCAPIQVARIVLDAGAVAHFLQHLEVITGPLFKTLGFEVFARLFELGEPFLQFCLDIADGILQAVGVCQILLCRINGYFLRLVEHFAR